VLAKPEALEPPSRAVASALATAVIHGREWGATEPFPFFCRFQKGELADAVRNGRKKEFAEAYAKLGGEIPDPLSKETRDAAVLDWDAPHKARSCKRLALTRSLLAARKSGLYRGCRR